MSLLQLNSALARVWQEHGQKLAGQENLSQDLICDSLKQGTMVLLGNPAHANLCPKLVGQPAKIKINGNIGTSPWRNCQQDEMAKLAACVQAGADTVMDLSIAGELDEIREQMLANCSLPLGTVPLYAVAQRYIAVGQDPADFTVDELLCEIEKQAAQGVDFMTVHCGVTRQAAAWADKERTMGIVSRGGSILARWMRVNEKENPLLTNYDDILSIARAHNVTLSLGDGLRPGAGRDAGDAAQWEEVIMLGRLAQNGLASGVQCMIEGPGHVPFSEVDAQIRSIKRLTFNAPLYVLGPLVTDVCPGYDHIAGAIGAANAVVAGADFLCYLTPAEHLTLPNQEDVRVGIMASRIAAQAGEAALGMQQALIRERNMARARKDLDWKAMAEVALDSSMVRQRRENCSDDGCAMCGDFCAIKMAAPRAATHSAVGNACVAAHSAVAQEE